MYKIKMMPGQEPYTPEELARLEALMKAAMAAEAQAQAEWPGPASQALDELEHWARTLSPRRLVPLMLLAALANQACGAEPTLRVGTFNIRYDEPADGPHAWSAGRRARVVAAVRQLSPDIMALQEVQPHQRDELALDLAPEWALEWAQVGPVGNAILYRTGRVELTSTSAWSLGPGEIGSAWPGRHPRAVLRAEVTDRLTGHQLGFRASHTSGPGPEAERLLGGDRAAVEIVALDANWIWGPNVWGLTPAEPAMTAAGWVDLVGPTTAPPTGWGGAPPGSRPDPTARVDWVMGAGDLTVVSSTVAPVSPGGLPCSDHWPVVVDVLVGPG